jgi:hypothetical protein
VGIIVTTVLGLAIWVVLWSFGLKGLDAFFLPLAMVLIAFVVRLRSSAESA